MLTTTTDRNRACGWRWRATLMAFVLTAAGCAGDGLQQPSFVDGNEVYWALELDQRAITMSTTSPYDTLTIVAVPRKAGGAPIAGLPKPTYVSMDFKHVTVTPEGVLVAVAPTDEPVGVIATLTVGNLKHADTAWVRIVDNPSPTLLGSFSIHPIPPDSAKVAMPGNLGFASSVFLNKLVHATDATGAPFPTVDVLDRDFNPLSVPDLLVAFRSSDPQTAAPPVGDMGGGTVQQGGLLTFELFGSRPGTVTLYASATAFGVSRADTIQFQVGWPVLAAIDIEPVAAGSLVNTFVQPALKVGTGAAVLWGSHSSAATTDVTFADTSNLTSLNSAVFLQGTPAGFFLCSVVIPYWGASDCDSRGNFTIPVPPQGYFGGASFDLMMAGRVFNVPGTYGYHSASHNASGQIIVVDER